MGYGGCVTCSLDGPDKRLRRSRAQDLCCVVHQTDLGFLDARNLIQGLFQFGHTTGAGYAIDGQNRFLGEMVIVRMAQGSVFSRWCAMVVGRDVGDLVAQRRERFKDCLPAGFSLQRHLFVLQISR